MRGLTRFDAPMRAGVFGRLRDRIRDVRNRLVQSARVQRLAIANPLTRRIAKNKAAQLFDLVAGFVYSQILYSCVRLELTEKVSKYPSSVESLAGGAGLPKERMQRLVDAAVALDLLAWRSDGRVGLGELGAALNANPGVKAMVLHHADLYEDLRDPLALLRGECGERRLNDYWAYATADNPAALSRDEVADYSDLMAASQQFIAQEVLAAYDFKQHRHILDIGGGDGTFAEAIVGAVPGLTATVFDLPAVAVRAGERLDAAGVGVRVAACGGDFAKDELPVGADLITIVRVLYDHDDAKVMQILRGARRAVAAGGRVLIAEPMADAPGAGRVGDAYFGFYLMAMGNGRARRPGEVKALLSEAGFSSPRSVPTRMPLQTGIVVADA